MTTDYTRLPYEARIIEDDEEKIPDMVDFIHRIEQSNYDGINHQKGTKKHPDNKKWCKNSRYWWK